ncbi:TPA: hypothetical protein HA246_04905 [Candidatus Woesearchaeota archaeon]|nr:hypothetical protein [Candidatus Woesearchaeota archaeon]
MIGEEVRELLEQVVVTSPNQYREVSAKLGFNGSMDPEHIAQAQKQIPIDPITAALQERFRDILKRRTESSKEGNIAMAGYVLPAQVRSGCLDDIITPKELSTAEILRRCGVDSRDVRIYVQKLVCEIFDWIDKAIEVSDGSVTRLKNKDDENLFRLKFLREYGLHGREDVEAWLRGFVLMAYADSTYRLDAKKRFKKDLKGNPLKLGLGITVPVNRERMSVYDISMAQLREEEHNTKQLKRLIKRGIIVTDAKHATYPLTINTYVRLINEGGVSDETAFTYINKRYGVIAFLGAVLADALDTYKDKVYDFFYGCLPLEVAKYIENRWKEKTEKNLVTPDEVMEVIYMSCKENHPRLDSSTSHTNLVRFKRFAADGSTAISSPLRGIARGERYRGLRLGGRFTLPLGRVMDVVNRRCELYSGKTG